MSQRVTVDLLKGFLDAFNRHDLDAIMGYFADDCVFYMPRGVGPRGDRYSGKADVRAGLAKLTAARRSKSGSSVDHSFELTNRGRTTATACLGPSRSLSYKGSSMKTRADIDGGRIGMLGWSQAGWIMPLAGKDS